MNSSQIRNALDSELSDIGDISELQRAATA